MKNRMTNTVGGVTGSMILKHKSEDIRRLKAADALAYRSLRLEALRVHPEAFGSSWEDESKQSDNWFAERIERNVVFGAFDKDTLCGCIGFYVQSGEKLKHKGVLWGLYVKADARGRGFARQLVEAVLSHAKVSVSRVCLTVVQTNEAAVRLYESCGFSSYGLERDALRVGAKSYDEILMALDI